MADRAHTALGQFPPIALVVLSHLHEDYFDRIVERDLDHSLTIVTASCAPASLDAGGFHRPLGLRTWEEASFEDSVPKKYAMQQAG